MSVLTALTNLMNEIGKQHEDPLEIEITLPYKVRHDLTLDFASKRRYDQYDRNLFNPLETIIYHTANGIVNIKALSEETKLRNEIKSRKEHLEQLENRLKELL